MFTPSTVQYILQNFVLCISTVTVPGLTCIFQRLYQGFLVYMVSFCCHFFDLLLNLFKILAWK